MNWKFWKSWSLPDNLQPGERLAGTGKLAGQITVASVAVYLLTVGVLGWLWDSEPDSFSVRELANQRAEQNNVAVVTGYATTTTLIRLVELLMDKRGGYLRNDVFPPGVWMDNVPSWEYGVLFQIRDMSRAMRIDFSRSQTQSTEDKDLSEAEGRFFFSSSSWIFPETENEYHKGIRYVESYLTRLGDDDRTNAQFYARADNIRAWLVGVETRLGSLSQRLSAAVGKRQLNVDLAGDRAATQATAAPRETEVKTPWLEIDNVFYEARGQAFALLHLLGAMDEDFASVLDDKNARVSLQQIIRELEPTQDAVWSPMILNGNGFGFVANHSLVMASYISRANAAIADLRSLLAQG
ncbi:MAG: DUF2333 family protein [Gammaproteobacteria bacterium]|nr:MAG: DUF2333 family protein [Gammaproteobacteria bacterium]